MLSERQSAVVAVIAHWLGEGGEAAVVAALKHTCGVISPSMPGVTDATRHMKALDIERVAATMLRAPETRCPICLADLPECIRTAASYGEAAPAPPPAPAAAAGGAGAGAVGHGLLAAAAAIDAGDDDAAGDADALVAAAVAAALDSDNTPATITDDAPPAPPLPPASSAAVEEDIRRIPAACGATIREDQEVLRDVSVTACGHVFHTRCIATLIAGAAGSAADCPLCRAAVPANTVINLFLLFASPRFKHELAIQATPQFALIPRAPATPNPADFAWGWNSSSHSHVCADAAALARFAPPVNAVVNAAYRAAVATTYLVAIGSTPALYVVVPCPAVRGAAAAAAAAAGGGAPAVPMTNRRSRVWDAESGAYVFTDGPAHGFQFSVSPDYRRMRRIVQKPPGDKFVVTDDAGGEVALSDASTAALLSAQAHGVRTVVVNDGERPLWNISLAEILREAPRESRLVGDMWLLNIAQMTQVRLVANLDESRGLFRARHVGCVEAPPGDDALAAAAYAPQWRVDAIRAAAAAAAAGGAPKSGDD
jgi:hypothetical protein